MAWVCTLQFQIIVPPLINFWIFCSYLDPPHINVPGFVLQIFQGLLKRIVLFAKL